jgi:S-adenosylmethionine decarboxylase
LNELKHVLFTLYECDVELLNDRMFIENLLYETATKCGSTFLNTVSHQFEPQGVTAVTLLAESHISIHTWPESAMAVCDIFTCGDHTNPMDGFWFMKESLKSRNARHREYLRPIAPVVPVDEAVSTVVSEGVSAL